MLVLTFRGDEAAQEHHNIFQAALNKNASVAADLLEEHILNGLEHTLAAM
jgi:DNA-binding GntR family transcriptional regulator